MGIVLHMIWNKIPIKDKVHHYSKFHGYATSWIQSNLSKILTIGKYGLTDWLFASRGQFEEISEKDSQKFAANYVAAQLVNKSQANRNPPEDSDELIFVSEQNTKKRRTSQDQTSSTPFSQTPVPVQMVAPMRPTATIVPQTTTPPIQNTGKSSVSKQKSNSRPRNKCMAPLMVNYLDKDSMEKFSSDIQQSLQKLLQANNLAPRNWFWNLSL